MPKVTAALMFFIGYRAFDRHIPCINLDMTTPDDYTAYSEDIDCDDYIMLWRIAAQPIITGFSPIFYGDNTLPSRCLNTRVISNLAFRRKPPRRQHSVIMLERDYRKLTRRDPRHADYRRG